MSNIKCKDKIYSLINDINSLLVVVDNRPLTEAEERWAFDYLQEIKNSLDNASLHHRFLPVINEASLHIGDILQNKRPANSWYYTLEPTKECLQFYLER